MTDYYDKYDETPAHEYPLDAPTLCAYCQNAVTDYVNQSILSKSDESFCDEICEKAFHAQEGYNLDGTEL